MKKIFTVLLCLSIATSLLWAQDIDETFVFMNGEDEVIENGATVIRNVVETDANGSEMIKAGIYVLDNGAASNEVLIMHYSITQIDNGAFQICFPSTCNIQNAVGNYATSAGTVLNGFQDIQSKWFPTADGQCVVTLSIEIQTKKPGFPPQYEHKAFGPSVTLHFIKSPSTPDNGSAYVQLADGVYMDGTTLYITSGVKSLGSLKVNPSEIYCYATIPPACLSNTFTGYDATLHVPAAGMVSYFTALYWYNFNNILSDAIEPLSVTMNTTEAEVEMGQQLSLSATVAPSNATPKNVYWSSTNPLVATVSNTGMVTTVAAGECDILATCVDKVAFCHVTVVSPRVTITLDKHEARLLPNHTMTLMATCTPPVTNLAVTTSNPAVAIPRYINGTIMVVGVGEGTATITVSTNDGWCNPDTCKVTVYTLLGDVNCDGYVDVSDVTTVISHILGNEVAQFSAKNADVNHDNDIDISDVTMIIAYILGNIDLSPNMDDEHEWVDLGLPSGTLWATCNIGASRPEERGYYFAWGETDPKEVYNWSTYKWCNGSNKTLTKYCIDGYYGDNGFTDGKTELDPEDDAAYVNWGPSWRMPTWEQLNELMMSCSWRWTSNYGVQGYQLEGSNGRTLFLPAGGIRWDGTISDVNLNGYYWSRSLNLFYHQASYLYFYSGNIRWGDGYDRCRGFNVRAVRVSQN